MRSLVMKFTLLCGVILVVATTLLMAVEYQLKQRDNTAAGLTHAELITELFTSTSANVFAVSDDAEISGRLLTEFAGREDVSSVYVTNVNRRVIAAFGETDYAVGQRAADHLVHSAIGAVDTRIEMLGDDIRVAEPIFINGRLTGAVVVTVPLSAVVSPAMDIITRQVLIALVALCVFLPLVAYTVRTALGPVRRLTEAARLASSRKLDLRIEVNTGDELEVLANAFNRMFARLDASVKRVHRLAYVDMITELPNRERFRKELERVSREATDAGQEGAILFLDLDRFKRVNDSLSVKATACWKLWAAVCVKPFEAGICLRAISPKSRPWWHGSVVTSSPCSCRACAILLMQRGWRAGLSMLCVGRLRFPATRCSWAFLPVSPVSRVTGPTLKPFCVMPIWPWPRSNVPAVMPVNSLNPP